MRTKAIIISVVLGIALGGGAWWILQNPDKSAAPSTLTAQNKDSKKTDHQALLDDLKTMEQKLESGNRETQLETLTPEARKIVTSYSGHYTTSLNADYIFKTDTLIIVGSLANVEVEVEGATYNQRLEKVDGHWYASYVTDN